MKEKEDLMTMQLRGYFLDHYTKFKDTIPKECKIRIVFIIFSICMVFIDLIFLQGIMLTDLF